jgi:hypothetical protein
VLQAPECASADYCFDRPTARRPTSAIATSKPPPGDDVRVELCHERDRQLIAVTGHFLRDLPVDYSDRGTRRRLDIANPEPFVTPP